MIIREVPKPNFKDLAELASCWPRPENKNSKWSAESEAEIVGSGKAAIALILGYLKEKKIIKDKLDEVIVPDWLGYWVYNQIQPFAFPAKNFSPKAKAIMVYHQYGWPQDMDKILDYAREKNLIVIEDCAHALAGSYKGKPLGSMGDFALYSFSKWFFCLALGAVKSKDPDFSVYLDRTKAATPIGLTFLKDLAKLAHERSTFSDNKVFKRYADLLLGMSYSFYGQAVRPSRLAKRLLSKKIDKEIKIRRERYRYFVEETKDLNLGEHFKEKDITPYVIPIIAGEAKNKKLAEVLRRAGVATGLYNFDINRNLLSPKFVQCVWLPCHSGISDEKFFELVKLAIKSLN